MSRQLLRLASKSLVKQLKCHLQKLNNYNSPQLTVGRIHKQGLLKSHKLIIKNLLLKEVFRQGKLVDQSFECEIFKLLMTAYLLAKFQLIFSVKLVGYI